LDTVIHLKSIIGDDDPEKRFASLQGLTGLAKEMFLGKVESILEYVKKLIEMVGGPGAAAAIFKGLDKLQKVLGDGGEGGAAKDANGEEGGAFNDIGRVAKEISAGYFDFLKKEAIEMAKQ